MIEKIQRMMQKIKSDKNTRSLSNRKNYEHITSQMETPSFALYKDGQINAFNTDNQQDNSFRPLEFSDLSSPFNL